MPLVIFESPDAPPLEAPAPGGGSLADLCDEVGAPVPFSCRSANCGTCLVEILAGRDELLPATAEEQGVLDIFGVPPNHRLACCAKMQPGLGPLRLRPADPDA